jgi:hypothetical protein
MNFRLKYLVILAFLTFSTSVFAQSNTEKKNIIKINLLSPIVRTASLFYERVVSQNSSVMLGFYYTGFKSGDTQLSGFGLTPAYRFYLSNKYQAPAGFYVSPYLRYQHFSLTNTYYSGNPNYPTGTDTGTFKAFGGGLELGYQWIFRDIITLNIFGGVGYATTATTSSSNGRVYFNSGGFDGFDSSRLLGVALGVAF